MVVCHPLLQADGEGSYPHLLRRLLRHTKVRHPQLIRPICLEVPIHPVQCARYLAVRHRRLNRFATPGAAQAKSAHQAFHRTARYRDPFALQLPPDLVSAVDAQIGVPDPFDVRDQFRITPSTSRLQSRISPAGRMAPITGRGNLQYRADRLDPETAPMQVDKLPQDLKLRSSSAWAKNALASFRISLAFCSSLT